MLRIENSDSLQVAERRVCSHLNCLRKSAILRYHNLIIITPTRPAAVGGMTHYVTTTLAGAEFTVPDYYTKLEIIGRGSYGCVARAVDSRNGSMWALKKVQWEHRPEYRLDYWRKLMREIRLMVHFDRHENMLNLKDIIRPQDAKYQELYLVSKYCETDLYKLMRSNPEYFVSNHILSIMYSLMCGLYALHTAKVMHRDLKPSNILIESGGGVKLADFGLGRDIPQGGDELTNYVVTRWYRAPEVLLGERYGASIDVWSLGCIFAEMLKGTRPLRNRALFPSTNQGSQGTKEQILMIINCIGFIPPEDADWVTSKLPKEWLLKQPATPPSDLKSQLPEASDAAMDLLCKMLAWNPSDRTEIRYLLRHDYLDVYAWVEGDEDGEWPVFDGSFSKRITGEAECRKLCNLEISRFNPEFSATPGVEIMTDQRLCTAVPDGFAELADPETFIDDNFPKR